MDSSSIILFFCFHSLFVERKFVFKDFFEKYKDKFLGSVNTHEIAQLLEIEKVIPESLCFELKRTSNDKATEMLYLHMRDCGSLETVHSLCDVMIKKEGYPKMNSLGRDMKKDLPVSYIQATFNYIEKTQLPRREQACNNFSFCRQCHFNLHRLSTIPPSLTIIMKNLNFANHDVRLCDGHIIL